MNLKLDQNNTSALIGLGNSYLISNDFNKALSYFEQALKIKQNLPIALEGKTICLYELKKKDELNQIIEELNKDNDERNKDVIQYLIKGNLLKDENNFEEAFKYYDKCLEINPKCYEAYYNKALCYIGLNDDDNALKNLENALNINKDFPQALDAKGCVYYSKNKYKEALECYNELTQKYKNNDDYFFKKASSEMELKKYEEAIKSSNEVLKLNPEHYKAMTLKGNCLDNIGNSDDALELYNHVISKDKDNNNELAHILRGQNLLKGKEYEKALNDFNKVYDLNPNNENALFYKALCLNKLKSAYFSLLKSIQLPVGAACFTSFLSLRLKLSPVSEKR